MSTLYTNLLIKSTVNKVLIFTTRFLRIFSFELSRVIVIKKEPSYLSPIFNGVIAD